jgi:hypothetical protein
VDDADNGQTQEADERVHKVLHRLQKQNPIRPSRSIRTWWCIPATPIFFSTHRHDPESTTQPQRPPNTQFTQTSQNQVQRSQQKKMHPKPVNLYQRADKWRPIPPTRHLGSNKLSTLLKPNSSLCESFFCYIPPSRIRQGQCNQIHLKV